MSTSQKDDAEAARLRAAVTEPLTSESDRATALERIRAFRGRLPPDFKFDRDEANAR